MSDEPADTLFLLQEWHGGDEAALARLVRSHLPFVRARVESRVGEMLRKKADVDDFVQEAMLEVLRYGPRFLMSDGAQFRVLLAKIVENVIRGQYDYFTAMRREMDKERELLRDTVLYLDPPQKTEVARPSQHAQRDEDSARVRAGLDALAPEQREVLTLRQWDGLSFAQIGARLGIEENTARMRFQRALVRLGKQLGR